MTREDRTILTCELTREELVILFEGIKKYRIKKRWSRIPALAKKWLTPKKNAGGAGSKR